jgi:gliding motility-associated-like protein
VAVYTVSPAQNVDSYVNATVLASVVDADGAITNAVISNGSLPAGTMLDAITGAIAVSDASLLISGTNTVEVTTTDELGGITIQTVMITFTADNEAIYVISAAQNIDSYTNASVLATASDADGAIVSAVLSSGSLPAGTTLNSTTGTITVTDASLLVAGTISFDVTLTDEYGGTTTQNVALTFAADGEAVYTKTPTKSIDSYATNDLLAFVVDPDGSIANAVVSAGTLPPGTSLNPVTGDITVANAALLQPGTYNFGITTTDSQGGSTPTPITLSFGDDHEAVYQVSAPDHVNAYSNGDVLATVTDADAAIVSASISSGTIPPGIILNPVSGEITVSSATALQTGAYTFEILTTDAGGGITLQPVTIELLFNNQDSDGDGIIDLDEDLNHDLDLTNDDTDQDGIPDYLDADDDGDGIPTRGEDLNGNGVPQDDDSDGDGIPNYLDVDDDNDGIPTMNEDANANGSFTDDDCDEDGLDDYLDPDQCDIVPEKGFSPNGDANNDFWKIRGIDSYPNNTVKVFNRWGNLVFETAEYNNNTNAWKGEANGKLLLGQSDVPDGTYFFMIKVEDRKPISGYVIVKH